MTLEIEIKKARESLGMALREARRIGLELAAKPDDGALLESFEKAKADTIAKTSALRVLESVAEVEAQHAAWTKPVNALQTRPGEIASLVPATARTIYHRLGLAEPSKRAAHALACEIYLRGDTDGARRHLETQGLAPAEVHALMGTQGDLGGFLIPEDFRAEVIRHLPSVAVMRGICRVVPTSASVLVMPTIQGATGDNANIYASGYTGAWKPEGYVTGGTAPPQQDAPKFGQARIPVNSWQPSAIELTPELLADSAAPLDTIVAQAIAETLGLDEDAAIVNGNGVGKPQGLLDAGTGLTTINSGDSADVTYAGLVDIFAGLPAQYRQNAKWLMPSAAFGQILKLSDEQSRPIFTPNEIPGMLWTKPMVFSEFVPTPAADSLSVVFGDFMRGYIIADRQELRIQRLIERFAPNVGILPTARIGGQVVLKNAFRVLKLKV